MPQIVTFIGWHNSGKTTLATRVVSHLKEAGYRVGVIKSSKETGIALDRPGTDTTQYRQAGADTVLLVAPDQMMLLTDNSEAALTTLAYRYFFDVDIIIGEGFKQAKQVAKIEVVREPERLLRGTVPGVIAVVTEHDLDGDNIFRPDQSREIAAFIEERFLRHARTRGTRASLLINGARVPMKYFVQRSLAGTVAGFVNSLKNTENAREIEIRITIDDNGARD
ncbi:MAG: molybdopterin-guanine dinucleotide biosynthesis protein B [Thermodesulfobacteriota bacterium]